jgi:hypothetical protein
MRVVGCGLRRQFEDAWKMLFYAMLVAVLATLQFLLGGGSAMHGLMIGGVFGILGHWRATWVSSARVQCNSVRADLVRCLEAMGYCMTRGPGELTPDLPRWSRFDSQNVQLKTIDGAVDVSGPYYVLKRLARNVALES